MRRRRNRPLLIGFLLRRTLLALSEIARGGSQIQKKERLMTGGCVSFRSLAENPLQSLSAFGERGDRLRQYDMKTAGNARTPGCCGISGFKLRYYSSSMYPGLYRCLGIPSTMIGATSPWISGRTYVMNSFVTYVPSSLTHSLGTSLSSLAIL